MGPHRWQPTRLPRPWDSPGKNTGVGCHFLLQCMKVKSESEVAQSCPTLSNPMDCNPPGSSVHGIFQARVLEWGALAFSEPRKVQFKILYRRRYLTRTIKDVYLENYIGHWWEKLKMTQAKGKLYFAHRLEALVLLKCLLPNIILPKAVLKAKLEAPWFQILLQNCSNQNTRVLDLQNRHTDQWSWIDRTKINTHMWSINLWQRSQE